MRLARIENPSIPNKYGAGSDFAGNVSGILGATISFILAAGGIAFVLMFMIGGFQWITSGGDKDAITRARSRIMHAVVGLVILFAVYAILKLLGQVLGVNLISIKLPSAI